MTTTTTYSLGSQYEERQRLAYQASLLDQITERFLCEAGLGAGLRVLDVGCGLDDVAMLAAQIVGPRGEVIAIDRDPTMLTAAEERAERAGLRLQFVHADVTDLDLGELRFDAAVGRLILMHVPDPVSVVRGAAPPRPARWDRGVPGLHDLRDPCSPSAARDAGRARSHLRDLRAGRCGQSRRRQPAPAFLTPVSPSPSCGRSR